MARRLGHGNHVYELDAGWARLPEGWRLENPCGVVVDSADRVYVYHRGEHPIIVFDPNGTVAATWGEGIFSVPHGLQIGTDDAIYCVDAGDHTLRKFTPDGKLLFTIGTPDQPSDSGFHGSYDDLPGGPPFNSPTNASIAPDGAIYVSDGYRNCRVHRFSADGQLDLSWGTAGTGPGELRLVHGICITPEGEVLVGDRENERVQRFGPRGDYRGEWRGLRFPNDIYRGRDGLYYVPELGYLTDRGSWDNQRGSRVTVRDDEGNVLSAWGDDGDPTLPGNLVSAHTVASDSQESLYVGEIVPGAENWLGRLPADCHSFQKFVRVR